VSDARASDAPERRRRAGEDDAAATRARALTRRWEESRPPRAAPGPEDDAAVLARLGAAVVPDFAAWCVVDLLEGTTPTRVVDVGEDPSVRAPEDLERLLARARAGEPALAWPAHAALATCVVEELRVEGLVTATVALGRPETAPGIGPLERDALRDVLWDAALELERARLRRRAREAVRDAQRVARRLHEVLAAALAMGPARDERALVTLLAERARDALDAQRVVVSLAEPALRASADRTGVRLADEPRPGDEPDDETRDTGWWRVSLGGPGEPVVGEVAVRRDAPATPEDREVLSLLARLASSALAASALHASVRASETRWRTLVQSAPIGIVETDLEGEVTWWNRAAGALFAWPSPPGAVALPPALREALAPLWGPVREGASPPGRDLGAVELADGPRNLMVAARRMDLGASARILTLLDDVTDHRRLRTELRHAATMETRGQVASTIAHDFNNLLTLITGYAEVLEGQVTSSEAAGLVRAIQVTAARAAALTAQLQSIGRTREGRPVVVDPRAALGANADVLERVLGPGVTLTWSWAPSIGHVRADPDQLEQVLLNLAINARDAMPDGGRLSIAVDEVGADDHDAAGDDRADGPRTARRGRAVRVRVVDTGVGMDEETRRRCFEPLFTTKGPLRGTGMGLASAKRTIEESGGSIRVDSRPGAGTTVEFVLPVVDEPLDEPASGPAPAAPAPRGRAATVLLVEDDEALRRLVAAVLRRHGHRVLDAPGVEEARALVAAHDEPFDLLVSDVVLGEGRGDELARALRATQPGLAILLTSGSADASVLGDLAAPAAFLAKPFKPSQVIDEVVALLRP
jgi:hypothetical protein